MKALMKPKKMGRFADGGEVTTMNDGSEQVNDMSSKGSQDSPAAEPVKKVSFKDAFASAKDGSTFEWNGKKYKKEYAKPAAKAESKPSQSLSQRLGSDYAALDRAHRNMPEGTSSAAREALTASRDKARKAYEDAADAERTGRSVVLKRANGGIVKRQTVKSHGRAC